jgi:hypothetical protein
VDPNAMLPVRADALRDLSHELGVPIVDLGVDEPMPLVFDHHGDLSSLLRVDRRCTAEEGCRIARIPYL